MTNLDDFFDQSIDVQHPRLRNWQQQLSQPGTSAYLELYRARSEFGQSQPEFSVQFVEDGNPNTSEVVTWDDDLNAGLIQLGVRAADTEQEAERFALGLRAGLRKPEREFGDGYFNAVLVDFLRDRDLARHEQIAEILKHVHANSPHRQGTPQDRYTICRDLIDHAVRGRARELTEQLNYPREEAKEILVSAIAHYLDDRFSVTTRRQMGLL